MNTPLHQLEALARQPALQVSPEQRPAIVGEILHHLMHPYFLTRTPEMQEKFGERQYQAFVQALAEYCLRGYIESPEPRLTVEFIKGLHRQFYSNAPSVPVKAVNGEMTTMVPGEFKMTRVFIRRHNVPGEWLDTTAPEDVIHEIERLLELLHDERIPLFTRYSRFILDFGYIHPFPDGNGKTYMLLGYLFLLKQNIKPPYFARFKWVNESLVYGLYDDYLLDRQRDISIFYPVLSKAYAMCGFDLVFDETIEASLLPRLFHTLGRRPKHERERLLSNFREHIRLLRNFLCGELCDGKLSVNAVIGFHERLYPPGFLITAMDNYGSPDKPGNPVKISPGAWRQREIRDEPFRSYRWCTNASPLEHIERDLERIISDFNAIQNPRREDVLRFYCLFLKVHPFADSNGTTAAVLSDVLCSRHGLAPLLPLNIRFKNKALVISLREEFEVCQSDEAVTNLLGKFDAFNQSFPIQRRQWDGASMGSE